MDVIFDLCDVSSKGKVAIYKLLSYTADYGYIDNKNEDLKKEILGEVLLKLNPSGQDTETDKATWVAAWSDIKGTEDDNVANEGLDNNNDVLDEFSLFNTSGSPDVLNQSKRSYRFSPSDTSSPAVELNNSNGEEVANLRHRIRNLQENLRLMQSQLQLNEDALLSEQTKNDDLLQKISRLDEKILGFQRDCEAHEVQLAACEAEKLTLCCTVKKQEEKIRELRNGIDEKTKENNRLNLELNETLERLDILQMLKDKSEKELAQYQGILHNQEKQLQAKQTEIDQFKAENEEINLHINHLHWENRNLLTRCEELESEIRQTAPHHCLPAMNLSMPSQSNASNGSEDVPSSVVLHSIATGVTSTPMSVTVPELKSNSLMQEFEAMGSFTSKDGLESSSEDEGCKEIVCAMPGSCTSSEIPTTVAFNTLTNNHENPPYFASCLSSCSASISVSNGSSSTSSNELERDLSKDGSIQQKLCKAWKPLGGVKGRIILMTDDYKETPLEKMHSSSEAMLTQVPSLHHKSAQTSFYESRNQSTQAGESSHNGDEVSTHNVKYSESKEASVQANPTVKESCAQTDEQDSSDKRTPLCSCSSKATSDISDYFRNGKQLGQSDIQEKNYESPTSTCQEMSFGDKPKYSSDVTAPVSKLMDEAMHSTVPDEPVDCCIPFKQTPQMSVARKRHFDKRHLYPKTEQRLENMNYHWMGRKLKWYPFFKFIFICSLFFVLLIFGIFIGITAILEVAQENGIMGGVRGMPPTWTAMFTSKLKPFIQVKLESAPL